VGFSVHQVVKMRRDKRFEYVFCMLYHVLEFSWTFCLFEDIFHCRAVFLGEMTTLMIPFYYLCGVGTKLFMTCD